MLQEEPHAEGFAVKLSTDELHAWSSGVEAVCGEIPALKMIPFLVQASLPVPVSGCVVKIIVGPLLMGRDRISGLKSTVGLASLPSSPWQSLPCLPLPKAILKSMSLALAQCLAAIGSDLGAQGQPVSSTSAWDLSRSSLIGK